MVTKIIKSLGVTILKGIIIALVIVYIPNLPPYAKISEPHSVTPAQPFTGKLALNERLNNAEIIFKGELHGPEAFAIYNNELYTTLHGGDVVKIVGKNIIPVTKFGKPCKGLYQEDICGRPLGMAFDKNGVLYVADAFYGVFKVDIKTGKYERLISINNEIDNKKPKLPNDLVLASNGDIYWTDSSSEFSLNDGLFDVLADGSGRVIHYDAKTKKNKVLLDNVHFTNGILLSKDESFLIVSETARNRLLRYYLKGTKKGTSDIFLDGLPGSPDNLQSDGQGGLFVPLVLSTDQNNPEIIQSLGPFPLIRRFFARVLGLAQLSFKVVNQLYPNEWTQKAVHFIGSFQMIWCVLPTPKRLTILQVSENGQIIDSLHALDGKIGSISDAIVFNDYLYLGSPQNDFLARVSLNKANLKHLVTVKDAPKVTTTKSTSQSPPATKPTSQTTTPPPQTTTPPPPRTTPLPKTAVPPSAATTPSVEEVKTTPLTTPPPSKATPTKASPGKSEGTTTTKPLSTPKTPTVDVPTAKTPTASKTEPPKTDVPKEKVTVTATPQKKAASENVKPVSKETKPKTDDKSKEKK